MTSLLLTELKGLGSGAPHTRPVGSAADEIYVSLLAESISTNI